MIEILEDKVGPNGGEIVLISVMPGAHIAEVLKECLQMPRHPKVRIFLDFNGTRREIYPGMDVNSAVKNWFDTSYNSVQATRNNKINQILND